MYSEVTTNRDVKFDILKVIGLLSIILAHVDTGDLVFQLRNFDVPLMVICSGALFCYSMQRSELWFWAYVRKRVARLLSPSYVFLCIYFFLVLVMCLISDKSYPYSGSTMIQEFFLRSRIVGLWIVRVFLLVSLAAPFLFKLYTRFEKKSKYLLTICLIYVSYEVIYRMFSVFESSILFKIMEKSLFEMVPYSCLFGIGIALTSLRKRTICLMALFFCQRLWCC
jgi:hypothetical protein